MLSAQRVGTCQGVSVGAARKVIGVDATQLIFDGYQSIESRPHRDTQGEVCCNTASCVPASPEKDIHPPLKFDNMGWDEQVNAATASACTDEAPQTPHAARFSAPGGKRFIRNQPPEVTTMANLNPVPFEKIPDFLQNVMHAYDEELGGSGFVQVFAHAPEVFRKFIDFYFDLELETRGAVDGVITELARLMVARQNNCGL
jgi:hypothetical protein